MNQSPPGDGKPLGDLEATLMRELGLENRTTRAATLKLQPVVLPPPPEVGVEAESPEVATGASAEDDIDPDQDEQVSKGRGKLVAIAAVVLAAMGGLGWFVLNLGKTLPEASVPTIPAPQPMEVKAPPAAVPAPAPTSQAAPVQASPVQAAPVQAAPVQASPAQASPPSLPDKAMGEVTTELTPPSTDGLSPARKVNTIRIIVENDREVRR